MRSARSPLLAEPLVDVSGAAHLGGRAKIVTALRHRRYSAIGRRPYRTIGELSVSGNVDSSMLRFSRDVWADIRDVSSLSGIDTQVVWRLSCPPAKARRRGQAAGDHPRRARALRLGRRVGLACLPGPDPLAEIVREVAARQAAMPRCFVRRGRLRLAADDSAAASRQSRTLTRARKGAIRSQARTQSRPHVS